MENEAYAEEFKVFLESNEEDLKNEFIDNNQTDFYFYVKSQFDEYLNVKDLNER